MTVRHFDSLLVRVALLLYRAVNHVLLLPLLVYLWWRGRKDPLYSEHMAERFGFYNHTHRVNQPVWVHAVSLGELRSAVPLIKALLENGEHIVTTHFTPVGRREALQLFAKEIADGRLQVLYVPLEYHSAFNRFYRAFSPKYGLVMEVEFWPCMIDSAREAGIPLFLCNGQYPGKSYHRDIKGLALRASLVTGFAGAMVKSDLQQHRFQTLGLNNTAITGELRFDQPVPQSQLSAAGTFADNHINNNTFVVTIASAVEGEDELYLECIQKVKKQLAETAEHRALFVYVPRAPERFDTIANLLNGAGLHVARRTHLLDKTLHCTTALPGDTDVLLGDSMGEMYFYLQLSQQVIVGGGFTAAGAHNISEAFAVSKPVVVGPTLWTIEYPAMEALKAGVLKTADDANALATLLIDAIEGQNIVSASEVDHFFADHTGAIGKTLAALPQLLSAHQLTTNR